MALHIIDHPLIKHKLSIMRIKEDECIRKLYQINTTL